MIIAAVTKACRLIMHVMYSDHLQSKTKSTQNGHFFEVVSHCRLLAKKTVFAGNNSIVKSS